MFVSGAAAGYAGALFALWTGARRRGHGIRLLDAPGVLIYWMFAGLAFYRAVWELASAPYRWNKTEHGVSRQRTSLTDWKTAPEAELK